MKTIINYLKEHKTYQHDVMGRDFSLTLDVNIIVLSFHKKSWKIDLDKDHYAEWTIQDILERKCNIEIRFCEECGKPMDEGFLIDDGSFYSCEDCFEEAMNNRYGEGNWQAATQEGEWGGWYECLIEDTWEDTGIFWTQWY